MRTTASPTWYPKAVAIGRIVIGVIFLWAGLEKVIGGAGEWSAKGFLAFGTGGTLGWPFVTEVVLEAGHCPHDEVPDQVNRAMVEWLATLQ